MPEFDLRLLKRLVRALASDDAFARRDAIEHLAVLTQQRLNFRWSADLLDRKSAIRRWRRWIAREERHRKGQQVQSTIQILASGQIDKSALESALKGLPTEQKKALMAQVLAKVTAHAQQQVQQLGALPTCQDCERRPATARVTELDDDGVGYSHRVLCEVCVQRGDRPR